MMKSRAVLAAMTCCLISVAPQVFGQNSIQLFGPVNVRPSASTTSYTKPAFFSSNTLNLSCPAAPLAVISSSANSSPANSSGYVLVDNNINVTVTHGDTTNSTMNVCAGGVPNPIQNCFTSAYQGPAGAGHLNGVNPDTLLPGGGVPPLDISSLLVSGSQQVKIDLEDEGGWLTSSTLYLNTNCSSGGVTAPATISGNTIPGTNPTTDQLKQDFTFNPISDNGINFEYDLSTAQTAGTLTIDPNGVIPSVGDSAIDPAVFQPTWVPSTPFATSICLVHNGETVPGTTTAGCKLFTLTCTIGVGSSSSGVNCPSSTTSNEILKDVFDGPAFTLDDIPTTVNGVPVTFHEGMGFLMASEPWTGGGCQFATGSGFENSSCPQNLLASFSGPGVFNNSATTTHPNSSFISIAKVPEDLTSVSVAGAQPGNWVNTSTPTVTLSSQPPYLANTNLPNAASFTPSPIFSIAYGISPADSVPMPGTTDATDVTLTNPSGCPTPANPSGQTAPTFTPDPQTLTSLSDGRYALHYLAKDCAGTQELKFVQDGAGSWTTNFYTVPINVDTNAPAVASGPTLSPAPPYYQGEAVTATFSCTDGLSGVVLCGGQTFSAGTLNTGSVMVPVNTLTAGPNVFSVTATDAAGNQSAAMTTNYTVNAVDSQIQLSLSPATVTYPLGTNLQVLVSNINAHVPTGTVKIVENGTTLATLKLGGGGSAFDYLKGLSAGMHSLTAVYSGDKYNVAGNSAPVTLNVLPVPVTLSIACWNSPYPYGSTFQCNVHASSTAGAAPGVIAYAYDGNPPVSLPLSGGAANIVITKPLVANHTIVVSYPAQTNFAAAGPQTINFAVSPAPVQIQLTPSTWYLTGGTLKLTASVKSWSAGPPNATGQVTFTSGATVFGSSPVDAAGVASISIPASSLANGNLTFTATYGGGVNYGTGSTSITVQVKH